MSSFCWFSRRDHDALLRTFFHQTKRRQVGFVNNLRKSLIEFDCPKYSIVFTIVKLYILFTYANGHILLFCFISYNQWMPRPKAFVFLFICIQSQTCMKIYLHSMVQYVTYTIFDCNNASWGSVSINIMLVMFIESKKTGRVFLKGCFICM